MVLWLRVWVLRHQLRLLWWLRVWVLRHQLRLLWRLRLRQWQRYGDGGYDRYGYDRDGYDRYGMQPGTDATGDGLATRAALAGQRRGLACGPAWALAASAGDADRSQALCLPRGPGGSLITAPSRRLSGRRLGPLRPVPLFP